MKRDYVFYVYDMRSQMTEFVASFVVRSHAQEYADKTFGEHGYVTEYKHHRKHHVWNGTIEVK